MFLRNAGIFRVRWRQYVPRKRRYPSTSLRGINLEDYDMTSPYTVTKWNVVPHAAICQIWGTSRLGTCCQLILPYCTSQSTHSTPFHLSLSKIISVSRGMRELHQSYVFKCFQISTLRWRSGLLVEDGVSAFVGLTCRMLSGVEMGHTLILNQ